MGKPKASKAGAASPVVSNPTPRNFAKQRKVTTHAARLTYMLSPLHMRARKQRRRAQQQDYLKRNPRSAGLWWRVKHAGSALKITSMYGFFVMLAGGVLYTYAKTDFSNFYMAYNQIPLSARASATAITPASTPKVKSVVRAPIKAAPVPQKKPAAQGVEKTKQEGSFFSRLFSGGQQETSAEADKQRNAFVDGKQETSAEANEREVQTVGKPAAKAAVGSKRSRYGAINTGYTYKGGVHRIAPRETLWRIADLWYADAQFWPNIYRNNLSLISDPDQLHIGWKLDVPGLEGTPTALTPIDRQNIADGYVHAYLAYSAKESPMSVFFLWAAQERDPTVKERFRGRVDADNFRLKPSNFDKRWEQLRQRAYNPAAWEKHVIGPVSSASLPR